MEDPAEGEVGGKLRISENGVCLRSIIHRSSGFHACVDTVELLQVHAVVAVSNVCSDSSYKNVLLLALLLLN